jgi:hypothetical protein
VPRDERGKSFLRAALDVFLQQNAVVQFQHLQVNAADGGMVTVSSAYLHSEQRTQPPTGVRRNRAKAVGRSTDPLME